MLFKDLKKEYSYRQIAEKIGITHGHLCLQVNHRGFSVSTIRKLISVYPSIDLSDLLHSYPRHRKNLNELQIKNLKSKESKNVKEDTANNRSNIVRAE